MRTFVADSAQSLLTHFSLRTSYLEMLASRGTTAEEWFRIEILGVLTTIPSIVIVGTNHRTQGDNQRPDFTLSRGNDKLLIELKVLPRDKNYGYGWQRFLAGKNNVKDFENLVAGTRTGVLYVYWPDASDWANCRKNIESRFPVECLREDSIACKSGTIVLSYWAAGRPELSDA